MISKYQEFFIDGKILRLISEGALYASDNFLSRLSVMRGNAIASTLYSSFSSNKEIDKDLQQNYIDITPKEDSVTFISDRSADRLKSAGIDDLFSTKGRNEIKIGRLVRPILTELGVKFTDKDIEEFVNLYKASKVDKENSFEIVSGEEIANCYDQHNYAKQTGSLGGSCMKDVDSSYFGLYVDNPKSCRMLVYRNKDNEILGRALVWKIKKMALNKECDAQYFMDRVYTANDSDLIRFVNYAKEQKWLHKDEMSSDVEDGFFFRYGEEILFGVLTVKLTEAVFDEYPFVDTLSFLDQENRLLSNNGFIEGVELNNTDGSTSNCYDCSGTGYEDIGDSCPSCDGNGEKECEVCKGMDKNICKSCEGGGKTPCVDCHSSGSVRCTKCSHGYVNCEKCGSEGVLECPGCKGKGNLGRCNKCNGKGHNVCPSCKGVKSPCEKCSGEGTYLRKWGIYKRRVTCPDCRGSKIKPCKQCWNEGEVECEKCESEGVVICPECDEFDMGRGVVRCDKCDGDGDLSCENCDGRGSLSCVKCDGNGNLGDCPDCDGSGGEGECPNKKCDGGMVKCKDCKGTGDRPKNAKSPPCSSCYGLFAHTLSEIRENPNDPRYKIVK